MVYISLFFLFVYLFGAYAYGAATLYSLWDVKSVWGGPYRRYSSAVQHAINKVSLALFSISTIWFVLHVLIEFRNLTGDVGYDLLDLGTFVVFGFPPVIMHTVYLDSIAGDSVPPPIFRRLLHGMYLLSPLIGLYVILAIFDFVPGRDQIGPVIGVTIGSLFTLASIYSATLILRRQRPANASQQRMARVMVLLFGAMSTLFVVMMFIGEKQLIGETLSKLSRSTPIYFMIAAVYFENRFEFYDLVVKRALLILTSVFVLGVLMAAILPWLEQLPGGAARPWLFAVALAPAAMIMPWLVSRIERWLDRRWLGREYTPVEAVKHVLAGMQPATDDASLVAATEARLGEIFGARILVLIGAHAPAPAGVEIETEVAMPAPVSGEPIRMAVVRELGSRRILSEDLAMLRSLAGVFGFMLENLRLQRRRQEQDQLAQELRLQSSKSELKALRAQINPHFLFNALNAIASLIHTDPGRADEAVEQLAEVFRYTLRRSDSEWAPLDQELTFARAYLDVERARFGQRLTSSIDSDHASPAPLVPSMLLQTLLENAVKHGVSQARGPGRIDVIVRTTPDRITLEVRNTGPSTRDSTAHGGAVTRSGQAPEGEGFGLRSVRERLKGHFGDRASFRLMRDESAGVTVARIDMPPGRIAA